MKIVILGSEGMLGTALMRVFEDATGLDKDELDITDREATLDTLQEIAPDLVINAAAYTNVDGAEMNRETAMLVNGTACEYIAEACREVSAKLVHFSTDYVFDGANPKGYKEDSRPNPLNFYGESKLAGEKAILERWDQVFLVRTSWLFGPECVPQMRDDSVNNGDRIATLPVAGKSFVDTMLRLGRERDLLKVVDDQIGKPTFTLDLARAVEKLIMCDFDYGIYHITNGDAVSWYDFAKEVFGITGLDVRVEPVTSEEFGSVAKRPKCSVLLNEKFPALRSHKEALEEYLSALERS